MVTADDTNWYLVTIIYFYVVASVLPVIMTPRNRTYCLENYQAFGYSTDSKDRLRTQIFNKRRRTTFDVDCVTSEK